MAITDAALRKMEPDRLLALAMDTQPFLLIGSTDRSRAAKEILRRLADPEGGSDG